MSFSDEHSQIRERLSSQIGDTPIDWPNASFSPPDPPSIWLRLSILDGESFQTTIGAETNVHRSVGIIIVQIFGPANEGDKDTLAMADTVAAIFRNWCGTTVRCRAATVKAIGPDGQGWYQVNVSVPFKRDELF